MSEKSKFLQMFEKLSPEEQDKVAQIALQMWDLITKKWIKQSDNP